MPRNDTGSVYIDRLSVFVLHGIKLVISIELWSGSQERNLYYLVKAFGGMGLLTAGVL